MASKYEITAAQKIEIEQARAKNKDKKVEYKLKALSMRADGASAKKISEATGYHPAYVSTLVSKYIHGGLEAMTGNHYGGNRRNMSFEEEQGFLKPYAGFGRINRPKFCWCPKGTRPSVPCHHIREYRYAYGAVEPITGESCFLIMPCCNTVCMNIFLSHLAKQYPDDMILLCCDGAAWHKSGTLCIPENIRLFFIPPYTPEMNPIEQIWKELRRRGFRNEIFATLEKVVIRLCDAVCSLSYEIIKTITAHNWIVQCFN